MFVRDKLPSPAFDKVVAIVSGGMDSVALAYWTKMKMPETKVKILSFNYGQRHRKELQFASLAAKKLGFEHHIIDLSSITALIATSSLTSPTIEVPEGHYAAPTMALTIVPNRNAIMLAIASGAAQGWATPQETVAVAAAFHAGDHFIYPDCRPPFAAAFAEMLTYALGGDLVNVWTPFIDLSKAGIANAGESVGTPWSETWSCYKGEELHCGRCGTCLERKEAFLLAAVEDPTTYEDNALYEEMSRKGNIG